MLKKKLTKSNGVWAWVCKEASKALDGLLVVEHKLLINEIESGFASILSDFNMSCPAKDCEGPEDRQKRELLERNLEKAQEVISSVAEPLLMSLKRKFA